MNTPSPFNLEAAIASWRRSLEHRDPILPDDLEELEQHVRDQVAALTDRGLTPRDAFERTIAEMGNQSEIEAAFREVHWPKLRRKGIARRHLATRIGFLAGDLRIALRSLIKRKGFAVIHILGLAVGLAAGLLILQYVAHERSYDDFHADADRIHRIRMDVFRGEERLFKVATTYPAVGPTIEETFPEVDAFTRLYLHYGGGVIRIGDRSFKEDLIFSADSTFFGFFSFSLRRGDRARVLSRPDAAVISTAAARKYFGEEDPIGRTFTFANGRHYEITGVAESPERSHLKFNFILAFDEDVFGDGMTRGAWSWYDYYTYVKLAPGAGAGVLEAGLPAMIAAHKGRDAAAREILTLQPLTDIHLHSDLLQEAGVNGSANSIYFLTVIAFVILGIAWVNYMNLSTARATERAREIGVRKALGARRQDLVRQFLVESMLVNLAAGALAVLLVWIAMPSFGAALGREFGLDFVRDGRFWGSLVVLFAAGALLSGFYPSLVLSSFKPSAVLRGSFSRSRRGLRLRQGLVVAQFAASVGLIAATIIIYQQIDYMRSRDLGIDIRQILVLEGPEVMPDDSLAALRVETFKNELAGNPHILQVAATSEIPGNLVYWTSGARKLRDDPEASFTLYRIGVDADYFHAFGHAVLAGRVFESEGLSEDGRIVVNRAAVASMGLAEPKEALGERLRVGGDTLEVIGVVANYHQEGLDKELYPIAFHHQPAQRGYFALRLESAQAGAVIESAERAFRATFPDNPFSYFFLDDHFDRQYRGYREFGMVFGFFSILALFVACLGLSGLASFTAAQRTKEIGIRRVLGSDVSSILLLLSKDFLKLVVAASIVAVPIMWYLMREWLLRFPFRLEIRPWPFAIACAAVLLIALVTVSLQSLRAATSDPVDTLRYE